MSDDKPTEPEKTDAASAEPEEKEADETEADTDSETEAEASDSEEEASDSEEKEPPREKRSSKKKRRERERAAAEAAAAKKSTSNAVVFALLGLAAGVAVGWFGHIAQAKAKARSDSAPAPAAAGSAAPAAKSGPCATLEKELCAKTGEASATCEQAKGAASLLTTGTCELALETVPAMVEKAKAARAVCDSLVERLCKDLTPTSGTCAMVKERTPSFPTERCAELAKNYEQVLAELKQMEEQGMVPGSPNVRVPPMPPGHGPGDGHGH